MITVFTPGDHYWIVGGRGPHLADGRDTHEEHSHVYSSRQRGYIPVSDSAYQEWISNSSNYPTRIATEAELADVLATHGLRIEG